MDYLGGVQGVEVGVAGILSASRRSIIVYESLRLQSQCDAF